MKNNDTHALPLAIKSVSKYYGSTLAVDSVTFSLKKGEIFGLLGPNGAGKTTIISMITTLLPLSAGNIAVFGKSVVEFPIEVKKMTGVVCQEVAHLSYFSLERILRFYSGYYGLWNNREREQWLLDQLGLWSQRKKKVRELSGGMKRRFMIARALLHKPSLLILDEPTAGVDVELRYGLWDFVKEIHRDGTTVLLTTHYLEEAETLCDRIAIIHRGKLSYVGEVAPLVEQMTTRRVEIALKEEVNTVNNACLTESSSKRLVFTIPASQTLNQLLEKIEVDFANIDDIKVREGNLEDAFRQMIFHQKERM